MPSFQHDLRVANSYVPHRQPQQTRGEVDLLARLRHPNIVEYLECFWTGLVQNIVMEYCEVCGLGI